MGNFLACCPYQKWFVKGLVEASASTTQDINLVQVQITDLLSRLNFCIPLYEPNLLLWGASGTMQNSSALDACGMCSPWALLQTSILSSWFLSESTRSSLIHAHHRLASLTPWVQELCDLYLDHCKSFLPSHPASISAFSNLYKHTAVILILKDRHNHIAPA